MCYNRLSAHLGDGRHRSNEAFVCGQATEADAHVRAERLAHGTNESVVLRGRQRGVFLLEKARRHTSPAEALSCLDARRHEQHGILFVYGVGDYFHCIRVMLFDSIPAAKIRKKSRADTSNRAKLPYPAIRAAVGKLLPAGAIKEKMLR